MEYIKNHGNVKKIFKGSWSQPYGYGYYAYIDNNDDFVIGEERGREGGELYRGEYKGEDTPWLKNIKFEEVTLYNNIVRYFRECENDYKNAVMSSATMTDMEKLNEIFSIHKEDIKKRYPQLYYAILAVLDKEKKPDASGYFNA